MAAKEIEGNTAETCKVGHDEEGGIGHHVTGRAASASRLRTDCLERDARHTLHPLQAKVNFPPISFDFL